MPHLQTNCKQQPERRDGSVSFPHTSGGEEYIPDFFQRLLTSWKRIICFEVKA